MCMFSVMMIFLLKATVRKKKKVGKKLTNVNSFHYTDNFSHFHPELFGFHYVTAGLENSIYCCFMSTKEKDPFGYLFSPKQ